MRPDARINLRMTEDTKAILEEIAKEKEKSLSSLLIDTVLDKDNEGTRGNQKIEDLLWEMKSLKDEIKDLRSMQATIFDATALSVWQGIVAGFHSACVHQVVDKKTSESPSMEKFESWKKDFYAKHFGENADAGH